LRLLVIAKSHSSRADGSVDHVPGDVSVAFERSCVSNKSFLFAGYAKRYLGVALPLGYRHGSESSQGLALPPNDNSDAYRKSSEMQSDASELPIKSAGRDTGRAGFNIRLLALFATSLSSLRRHAVYARR
jgi:hypothetical protein